MNNKPDILMAVHPKHCFNIFEGYKTKELRKMFPKLKPPFRVHVYCTKGIRETLNTWRGEIFYDTQSPNERPNKLDGKVIGSFICDGYEKLYATPDCERIINELCLTNEDIKEYLDGGDGYAWNITEPKLYDKPKELGEFRGLCKYDNRDCWLCSYYDYSNMECKGRTVKSPQSWCYVEELNL